MTNEPEMGGGPTLVRTGIEGLDDVLHGGLTRHRMYLVEGSPGAGKTTLAMQFLLEGVRRGEPCMFVTLSESLEELQAAAKSHGWTLDGVQVLEILASEESLLPDARSRMFHPSEVELAKTTEAVLTEADRVKPARLVVDSLSEFRLLADNDLRYRRQVLAIKQHFAHRACTMLFIDDRTDGENDRLLYSLAHGVVDLERRPTDYGTVRQRLRVSKMRGHAFREGYHDFAIRRGGLQVFPRLVAAEHGTSYARETVKSGLEPLDALLGGGLAVGTSTLILGAAGTGKSTLATVYAQATAQRGQNAALFVFDELVGTFLERAAGLGMELEPLIQAGRLSLRQVDPAELSPGEFSHIVRQAVDRDKARLVVIDSLTGYMNAMPSERFLALHLHEILSYLGQQGVTTLLILAQHGVVGTSMQLPLDATYLTDTVVLLRYFEAFGGLRQAISVIKKRTGWHERTIRELHFDNGGIHIGDPIVEFQGVLAGSPEYVGGLRNRKEGGDERRAGG